ncbi:MAG: glycosyltransferase family 4 protein [Spirulinaceae cyanobacterium]
MPQKVSLLAPDLSGGGGTRAYLIAKVLQKLHYDVEVIGFLFGKSLYPLPPENLEVKWVEGCDYPQLIGSIKNLQREINGEIIYAIKPRLTSFGMALLKSLGSSKPVILDIDDWEMSWFGGDDWQYRPNPRQLARDLLKKNGALRNPEHPLYLSWMEKLIDKADRVTVNNKFLQYRYGGTYLPSGKDTELFDPNKFDPQECRARYGLSEFRVLMFPGTARPHKGLEDVLAAIEGLNQPDLKLVLVGGRDIGDGYVEKLMAGKEQYVMRLPQTPLDKMPEVVAAADIVVVPQRESLTACAQFPIKLTDGMAMAKPIISTTVGDIPEILGNTGYLVEPSSPEQIAEKIEFIFANLETANAKGTEARQRCVNNYGINTMAATLSQLIEGV